MTQASGNGFPWGKAALGAAVIGLGLAIAYAVNRDDGSAPAPPPVAVQRMPGPSAADVQAASALPLSEQREMAEGMVARLDARLKSEPKNPDGWIMLMRSRMSLGQPDKASQALKDALAANPDQADMLRQQAEMLGVK